ncbi:site-specific integrase [Cellulophaga sp. L1A9]|uniref:site-specific integrase n=1 Tax=Cellulophaga sp. L1A9 TaxID=2686362 RepID=UPI00131D0A9E|nr:site-specific integrase [Cellulophaga sp. L1A9]
MATVKFQLQSKKDNSPIYLRLSINRNLVIRRKTGLFINFSDWSSNTSLPKQTTPSNKNTSSQLQKLAVVVIDKFNDSNAKGAEINGEWLQHCIEVYFKRKSENGISELLTDSIVNVIDTANTRENSQKGIGLSKSRINSYKNLLNIIKIYQGNKFFKVKDVDIKFGKDFLNWMLTEKNYSEGYARKKIDDLKTVCSDAGIYGIETSLQLKKVKGGKPKNENILYLNPDELLKIKSTIFMHESLINVSKWILLGCSIGQRGGDLLSLSNDNFINRNGLDVIELKQQKTGKDVTIPVLPTTKEILESGLPHQISLQRLNEKIKEVCRLASIDEFVKGGKIMMVDSNGKEILKDVNGNYLEKGVKRKVNGLYPKYELMTSHVCRRSFATNLYGVLPTALIMRITAHSTEKMFLNYIGKGSLDYAQQIADFYTLQTLREKKEGNMTVVKNAISE